MKKPENTGAKSNSLKCLIVEDNFFAADVLSIYFKRIGIDCEIAKDGEAGLNMYREAPSRYDMIFCDLQMPILDGHELAKRIRGSGLPGALTIPIVAMSGTITGDADGKSSFSYFLKKPFDLKCLPGVIDEIMQDQKFS